MRDTVYFTLPTLIDVSLLMALPDCELLKYRNVGKITLEAINELKKLSAGLSDGEAALHSMKTGWTANVSPSLLFLKRLKIR